MYFVEMDALVPVQYSALKITFLLNCTLPLALLQMLNISLTQYFPEVKLFKSGQTLPMQQPCEDSFNRVRPILVKYPDDVPPQFLSRLPPLDSKRP